jgi:hypothetical protein
MTVAQKLTAEAKLMQDLAEVGNASLKAGLSQDTVKTILERMAAVVEEGDD